MDSEPIFDHSTTEGKIQCLLKRLLHWNWFILAVSLLTLGLLIFVGFSNISSKAGNSPLKLGLGTPLHPDTLEECLLHKGLDSSTITFRDRDSTASQYEVLNFQWNRYKGEIRPFAYVLPRTVQEVQDTIQCTRSLGIRVVARSGGHSGEKYCFGNSSSVVIDFQKQVAVSMNMVNKTVEVQSGVRAPSKLLTSGNYFLPHGMCKTVGISYSLGGGYNNFIRRYGHVLSMLLELDMVDYNGSVITANKDHNSDLFWALRGGGAGGSFGLVTRYKFELRLVPEIFIHGTSTFPIQSFPQVFAGFQTFTSSNTDQTLYMDMVLVNSVITVQLLQTILFANSSTSTPDIVPQLFKKLFPSTNTTQISSMNYDEYKALITGFYPVEGGDEPIITDNVQVYQKQKSFFVSNVVGQTEIELMNLFIQNVTQYVYPLLHTYGGVVNETDPQETAFVHTKGVLYEVNLNYVGPLNRSQSDEDAAIQWMNDFYQVSEKILGHNSSYQNIPDSDMKDFLQRYYGANLKRLQEIKKKYDPENYFQYQQSIPPI